MEIKQLNTALLLHISQQLSIALKSLVATIELLDEGSTVPFIARYRKEVTGNLDEVQIRAIEEKLAYFRELEERRATILKSIEEQGKLTPELKAKLEVTLEKKISICLTNRSAERRRRLRGKRDWSRWRSICGISSPVLSL
jgi:protein Tex